MRLCSIEGFKGWGGGGVKIYDRGQSKTLIRRAFLSHYDLQFNR